MSRTYLNPKDVPISEETRAELQAAARKYFGFSSLRSGQAEIMACARRGENVLAILPTGAGKSLCYQLPALMDGGTTLVISPLIALMKDQVDGLPRAFQKGSQPQMGRARAVALNSSMESQELAEAIRAAGRGQYNLILAAPERLRQQHFLHALRSTGITRLVIDEAHCVSAWGHDFRPDYLYIARAHRNLGSPPILALTATAPEHVRRDIERRLFQEEPTSPNVRPTPPNAESASSDAETAEPHTIGPESANSPERTLRVIALDSFRPNLRLAAEEYPDKDAKLHRLVELCESLEGSGIVYARTRRQCEHLAGLLKGRGVLATHYHAGIQDRALVQERFMRGSIRVIVATIAFGMGVDKPDIRFIIHFGLPDSLEGYYQEAGRAGRDSEPAYCILLHSSSDRALLTRNANRDALEIEFLRALYAAVQTRRVSQQFANVSLYDLVQALRGEWSRTDDVKLRVGLSLLEQSKMLRRRYDRESHGGELMLELLPPPPNGTERVSALLTRYAAIQKQRIEEITAYARSRRCLHGHLAGYLGGEEREQCGVCDRCAGDGLLPEIEADLPDEEEQLRIVLETLSEQSWGRRSLTRLLRGDPDVRQRIQRSRTYGALNFRSRRAVEQQIDRVVSAGLVEEITLSHGGVALAVSRQGQQVLKSPGTIEDLLSSPRYV